MKRILLVLSALLFAAPAFGQVTPSTLMGVGMPAQLATEVVKMTVQQTADGADSGAVYLRSGGGSGSTRGASITAYGNEVASLGGAITIDAGAVSTGSITIGVNDGSANINMSGGAGTIWTFSGNNGSLTSNVTNGGSLIFAGTGDTISVQEATPATACMGVSTPNGTTPVAVTTSCATTGARIFYTRAGAVTNMASISTTTAASGSGFSFASTGASDTLASSVIWFIIKESA